MDKFCITFAGELKDGWSREKVISELGKLFRVDPEHLRKKIFTDSAVVLKKIFLLKRHKNIKRQCLKEVRL